MLTSQLVLHVIVGLVLIIMAMCEYHPPGLMSFLYVHHCQIANNDVLNCYYARGEENSSFQRRSYWMLDP